MLSELQAVGDAIERAVHESYDETSRIIPVDATNYPAASRAAAHCSGV